jgi:hypothetical protein
MSTSFDRADRPMLMIDVGELTAGRPVERVGGAPAFRPSSLPALFRRR